MSRAGGNDVPVWVRVEDWMLVENEPPRPDAGSLLRAVGVRVRGVVTAADGATPDGVTEVSEADGSDPYQKVYALTGTASDAQDVWTNTTRWRRGSQHAGVEFVLTVGRDRFQVQTEGRASDVVTGSRLTATGSLALVGEYEWDAFELADTRADWLVTKVVDLPRGDIEVELAHPPSASRSR